jgi:hypothetical protein
VRCRETLEEGGVVKGRQTVPSVPRILLLHSEMGKVPRHLGQMCQQPLDPEPSLGTPEVGMT